MQQALHTKPFARPFDFYYRPAFSSDHIVCDWEALRTQLLYQWQRLTEAEVDYAGPNRRRIAQLVERKYGIAYLCVENYLRNFERTMPL